MRTIYIAMALLASPVLAQDDPVLSGPKVDRSEKRVGIGEQRYAGQMMMPEVRPEIAAVDLLKLDERTRRDVDRVLAARAAIVDKAVLSQIDKLASLQGAADEPQQAMTDREGAAGLRQEAREVLRGLYQAIEPLRERGSLAEELREVLPNGPRTEFDDLLQQHAADALANAKQRSEAAGREFSEAQYRRQQIATELRLEVRASLDRTVLAAAKDFEAFLTASQLSPDGEAVVRREITDLVEKTRFRPQPELIAPALRRIFSQLERDDRRRLIEALQVRRNGGMSPTMQADDGM